MTSSSSDPIVSLRAVHKSYRTPGFGRIQVLSDLSMEIPSGVNVGIMGRNGAGKSTLLRLIGGLEKPDSGRVVVSGTPSPPKGLTGGINPLLSGRDNAKFVCRVCGLDPQDTRERIAYMEDVARIGRFMDRPVNTYSSGMRARLNFAINMAFEYDLYLFDELGAVGDEAYRRRASAMIEERKQRASFLIVSHSAQQLRRDCQAGIYVADRKAEFFPQLEDAIRCYEEANAPPV